MRASSFLFVVVFFFSLINGRVIIWLLFRPRGHPIADLWTNFSSTYQAFKVTTF
uniref:Uncharacterized protein n=1 Tax=Octopus bimaculoides TaxID=37653 RepID=A0A0L8HZD5_OCTBM